MFWRNSKSREEDLERELRSHLESEALSSRTMAGIPAAGLRKLAHYRHTRVG
jgi:hypothetical protein